MKWDRIIRTLFATVGIMATGVAIMYLVLAINLGGWFLLRKDRGCRGVTDYIERETALNFMTSVTIAPDRINAVMEGMALYAEHIKAIPAADVVPVVHAEWKVTDAYPHRVYCGHCFLTYAQEQWTVWKDGTLPRK